AIGIYPRFLCIPHAWVAISFATSAEIVEGGDQINALLTLILVPVLLLDSRRWHWSQLQAPSPYHSLTGFFSWSLFRFQVAFVYYEAGVYKTMIKEWADGTALYYFMNDSVFGLPVFLRPLFHFIFSHGLLLTLLTWSVMVLEILLAAALFMDRRWWKFLITPALFMHFSIVYIHGLGTFFLSMAAALIGYLVPWDGHLILKWPRFSYKPKLRQLPPTQEGLRI
ncbi:MAG: hypothetical protein NTX25_23045, partial [Proteobacteria bacterium]|nr:hypothetical protein [Pseudomonadota bacterium]